MVNAIGANIGQPLRISDVSETKNLFREEIMRMPGRSASGMDNYKSEISKEITFRKIIIEKSIQVKFEIK